MFTTLKAEEVKYPVTAIDTISDYVTTLTTEKDFVYHLIHVGFGDFLYFDADDYNIWVREEAVTLFDGLNRAKDPDRYWLQARGIRP